MSRGPALLIAPPAIADPRFQGSVIMLTHSTQQGDFGFCVNRPTEHTLADVTRELGISTVPHTDLYWGGPVHPSTIWMLHDTGWSIDQTRELDSDWAMTSHKDMFTAISEGHEPRYWRMFFGFCHWRPGQLDSELKGTPPWQAKQSWLLAESLGPEWLFEQSPDQLWESATTESAHQAVDSWL
jgi:putative transcriptional regulator